MDDPMEIYEQAVAARDLPDGPMSPQSLIKLYGIHPDDRVQVFHRMRKIGLMPHNPNDVLRRYDPGQVAFFLKQLIDGVQDDTRSAPIQRLSGVTYKSVPRAARVIPSKDGSLEEVDGGEGDPREDETQEAPGTTTVCPKSVGIFDPEQLVTPAEASEILGKKVKNPGIWISGLVKRKGLLSQGKRGRSNVYRLGDIKERNKNRGY